MREKVGAPSAVCNAAQPPSAKIWEHLYETEVIRYFWRTPIRAQIMEQFILSESMHDAENRKNILILKMIWEWAIISIISDYSV